MTTISIDSIAWMRFPEHKPEEEKEYICEVLYNHATETKLVILYWERGEWATWSLGFAGSPAGWHGLHSNDVVCAWIGDMYMPDFN